MNVRNKCLLEAAIAAIDEFHGDTSVSQEETLEGLKDIRSHVALLCQTLEDEIQEKEDKK